MGIRTPQTGKNSHILKDAILLVDDSSLVIELLRFALKDLHIPILTAGSVKEAMARLKEANVRMIITDIRMPEIDGFTFIKGLKANPEYAHILTVVLTGDEGETTEEKAYALGAEAFISKPFIPRELCNFVQGQLQREKIKRMKVRRNAQARQSIN